MDISLGPLVVILLVGVIILLGTGMWVGLALGVMGLIGVVFLADAGAGIGSLLAKTLNSYTMAAVPMFIFMAELLLMSGISQRLY